MKTLRGLFSLLALVLVSACDQGEASHWGEWKGENEFGGAVALTITGDGTGTLSWRDQQIPFRHEVIEAHDPMWLDLIFKVADDQEQRLHTLFQVQEDGSALWHAPWSNPGVRAEAFPDDEPIELYVLSRSPSSP